jgi:hypothetical protein
MQWVTAYSADSQRFTSLLPRLTRSAVVIPARQVAVCCSSSSRKVSGLTPTAVFALYTLFFLLHNFSVADFPASCRLVYIHHHQSQEDPLESLAGKLR